MKISKEDFLALILVVKDYKDVKQRNMFTKNQKRKKTPTKNQLINTRVEKKGTLS